MRNSKIPEQVLSLVYAAATDSSKWPEFCAALNRYAGVGILMFGHDIGTHESVGIIGGGFDPAELDRYHTHFADKNSWMHMNAVMPVGVVGISDAALSQRDLFKTEFYNDWLRHQENVIGGPALICHRSDTRFVAMAMACRARGYDDTLPNTHHLLQNLAPHLVHSLAISAALAESDSGAMQYLHACRQGIMLVHRSGRIGFINKAAERFLSDSSIAGISPKQKLMASDEKLKNYIYVAVRAMQAADFNALPQPLALSTLPCGPIVFHAHIFPDVAEHDFPDAVWSDPVVGALVITGSQGLKPSPCYTHIAKSVGATPAEARLAEALMAGDSLYEFAEHNGLSRHTVRNQMRALLSKTQTRNQAEFILQIHNLTSPFELFDS